MGLPASAALTGAALAVAAGLGYVASSEHAKRLSAEHAQQAWKDSVAVAVRHADSAVADFRTLDSAYHHPAPGPAPRTLTRIDSILVPVAAHDTADSARVAEVHRLVVSLQAKCDSDSAKAAGVIRAAEVAVDSLQSAIRLAKHPPPPAPVQRVSFYGVGAYDVAAHQPYVGAGVELHLGQWAPFASAGATLGGTNHGQLLAGVRYTFH